METSTSDLTDLLGYAAILFAILSAAIVVWYLARRPPLQLGTKLALLFGIFVFPILSAGSGNIAGYEQTKSREFCNGCHVMNPYIDDANDALSQSLAAQHGRNDVFGGMNCYECHADYGMLGPVTTKMNGMVHALHYYETFRNSPAEEAFGRIKLFKPYPNRNCTKCHSMTLPGFIELPDHKGVAEELKDATTSCVGSGCHGPAHPFSKKEEQK